jgi:murein DD-endopeptidase MepM/ murein hydrolase activator NlpD
MGTSTNPCNPDPCNGHGTCGPVGIPPVAACACDVGYDGPTCDVCAAGFVLSGNACVDRVLFALPMDASMISSVIGFDNDPAPAILPIFCQSYHGTAFPDCYDGHTGTDFIMVGGFPTMDSGSTPVLAAAPGEVFSVHDGEFDRCAANILTAQVECPGYANIPPANHVKIRHADGKETWYWHLKKDSTVVQVGDLVDCGQELGLVGSSGLSSGPHLHFAVVLGDGTRTDAYAGQFSHPETHWVQQGASNALPGAVCQ